MMNIQSLEVMKCHHHHIVKGCKQQVDSSSRASECICNRNLLHPYTFTWIWTFGVILPKEKEENLVIKGFRLYSVEDMSRMQLPNQWWYTLNTYGEGYAIRPPLKMKQVLSWISKHQILKNGKLTHGPQMPIENICIDFVKRPCNINNL